jgi:hypothetical protein
MSAIVSRRNGYHAHKKNAVGQAKSSISMS